MTVLVSILLALVAFFFIAYPFFRKPQAPHRQKNSAKDAGFCPKCGVKRREGDIFCPRCGASLIKTAENDE
ncbi:MAG: zinc ribbon domain-containing protein [Dehalococcoidales bacterium]|nr:MAG: zinc ribbon domain-containing protein [Dehalococcoidales bacterium]